MPATFASYLAGSSTRIAVQPLAAQPLRHWLFLYRTVLSSKEPNSSDHTKASGRAGNTALAGWVQTAKEGGARTGRDRWQSVHRDATQEREPDMRKPQLPPSAPPYSASLLNPTPAATVHGPARLTERPCSWHEPAEMAFEGTHRRSHPARDTLRRVRAGGNNG